MMRVLPMIKLAVLLTLLATPVSAQGIDLGVEFARTYSVSAGTWVPATVPSVVVYGRGFSLANNFYFDRGFFFEHDLVGNYEWSAGRLTVSSSGSWYRYRDRSHDWAWSVGARWKLR